MESEALANAAVPTEHVPVPDPTRRARNLLWFYMLAISIVVLGRILFDQGATYAPDPSAFVEWTNLVADAMRGARSWIEPITQANERTLTFMMPVAFASVVTGFRSPEFAMAVAWAIYVLPLPLLYLQIVRVFRQPCEHDYGVAALFLASTPILILGVQYFTDVPSLTMALAGMGLAVHALRVGSVLRLALGTLLIGLAVSVRVFNCIPYALAAMLFAVSLRGRLRMSAKDIGIGLCLGVVAFGLVAWALRFDLAFMRLKELGEFLPKSMWRYAVGGDEHGVGNVFSYRFWRYLAACGVFFPAFFAVATVTAVASPDRASGGKRPAALLLGLALAGILAYCLFAAETMVFNSRYVVPIVVLLVPIVAATHLGGAARRLVAIICILTCMDVLIFHSSVLGGPAPVSRPLASAGGPWLHFWLQPIGRSSGRNVVSAVPSIVEALVASKPAQGSVDVAVLSRNSTVLNEDSLRYYLRYMSGTRAYLADAARTIRVQGEHHPPMEIPEIYDDFAFRNGLALSNAAYIVAPLDEDGSAPRADFWVERSIMQEIRAAARSGQEESIGLSALSTTVGRLIAEDGEFAVRYRVYRVDRPEQWGAHVKSKFCSEATSKERGFLLWCGRLQDETLSVRGLPVSTRTMASAARLVATKNGSILELTLKWPPGSDVDRIYVHFIPDSPAPKRCEFFTVDHDVIDRWLADDRVVLPAAREEDIAACTYSLNVGFRVRSAMRDVFDAQEFQRLELENSTEKHTKMLPN